jgi:hypothetical protein
MQGTIDWVLGLFISSEGGATVFAKINANGISHQGFFGDHLDFLTFVGSHARSKKPTFQSS